ncbi:hypothetical protein U1Q18_050684 [Sarracenia purpurea var. burkii]
MDDNHQEFIPNYEEQDEQFKNDLLRSPERGDNLINRSPPRVNSPPQNRSPPRVNSSPRNRSPLRERTPPKKVPKYLRELSGLYDDLMAEGAVIDTFEASEADAVVNALLHTIEVTYEDE